MWGKRRIFLTGEFQIIYVDTPFIKKVEFKPPSQPHAHQSVGWTQQSNSKEQSMEKAKIVLYVREIWLNQVLKINITSDNSCALIHRYP